jgi:hypothetical protein
LVLHASSNPAGEDVSTDLVALFPRIESHGESVYPAAPGGVGGLLDGPVLVAPRQSFMCLLPLEPVAAWF